MQRGFKWGEGLSSTSCGEHEYYEELLRFFRHSMRVSIPLSELCYSPVTGVESDLDNSSISGLPVYEYAQHVHVPVDSSIPFTIPCSSAKLKWFPDTLHLKDIFCKVSLVEPTLGTLGLQLFPYHVAEYVCRVLRVTPFRYYCDLLFMVMRDERSYDYIPNFTVWHAPHIIPSALHSLCQHLRDASL